VEFAAADGATVINVPKILGRSTLVMTMRYAHFAPDADVRRSTD
jgi:hypothetical protein